MVQSGPVTLVITAAMLLWCGAAAVAAEPTVRIADATCARLVEHRPAPDVAYQPGVDAHGKPVAPADLPGSGSLVLPEMIRVAITVDLQKRFGIPANSVLFEAEAEVGTVEFQGDRLTFNGQPLGDAEARALAEACQQVQR